MSYQTSDAGAVAGWIIIGALVAIAALPVSWWRRRYQVVRRGWSQL